MNYRISHPDKIVKCTIDLPSSKSISNRVLIINSLTGNKLKIQNLSSANDTIYLQNALKKNGIIDIGHAGTALRFLTSYLSIQEGKISILKGSDRIHNRPIIDLVEALISLGADIKYLDKYGFAPLKIYGKKLKGGEVKIKGDISSQFISSLLLIAPTLENGLTINISTNLVSKTYIQLTLKLLEKFGINSEWKNNLIKIKNQQFIFSEEKIEGDWSAASFWYEIAALSQNCEIYLNNLTKNSFQGDLAVKKIYENFGVKSEFINSSLLLTKKKYNKSNLEKINLLNTPDLYQPIKCTLYAKKINAIIQGTNNLKYKESSRVKAVDSELRNLNNSRIIQTYEDHRMAMSFAPLCLKYDDIQINNIDVVNKSYPNYWKDLKKAGFTIYPLAD